MIISNGEKNIYKRYFGAIFINVSVFRLVCNIFKLFIQI